MSTKKSSPHPTAALSMEKWKQLYDAAFRVQKMAPWTWMEEIEILGIQPAGAKEPAFVSVMGELGEYYAIGVYPSHFALSQFWSLRLAAEDFPRPDALLETQHLQVVFGMAEDLEPAERNILKELGYSPRGSNAWPCFRSFRPGYMPWFIEPAEADLLLAAMEQVLYFAPRLKEDPCLLPEEIGPDVPILVRLQTGADSPAAWTETYRVFPLEMWCLDLSVPMDAMKPVRALPRNDQCLEVDVPLLPFPVGETDDRPKIPYLLMVADRASQLALGVEMLTVETTIQDLWESIPVHLIKILEHNQIRPARLAVKNRWVQQVLTPLSAQLEIDLELVGGLPTIQEIQNSIELSL